MREREGGKERKEREKGGECACVHNLMFKEYAKEQAFPGREMEEGKKRKGDPLVGYFLPTGSSMMGLCRHLRTVQ